MRLNLFSIAFLSALAKSLHATSYVSSENGRFSPNAIVYQLFEKFRSLILSGDADNNVPVLDPYHFEINRFVFSGIISGEINITDADLLGLGSFRLDNFKFFKDDLSVEVQIIIPALKLEAEYYKMQGNIFEAVPLSGSGILNVTVEDIILNTKIYFKQSDNEKSVIIDQLEDTRFVLGQITSFTEFDKNIDTIFNTVIADYFAPKLSCFSRYISATYQDSLIKILNPVLEFYDTWSILSMIL